MTGGNRSGNGGVQLQTNSDGTLGGIIGPGGSVIGPYVPTALAGAIRNFTLANTARIRKMRAGGRRRIRLVFLGDSLLAGTGADDNNLVNMRSNGMVALLAKLLTGAGIPARQDYGGGTGSVNTGVTAATLATIDPRFTFTGCSTLDGYKSLGGNMIRLSTAGDSFTFTPGSVGDTVELLFAKNTTGQGNFNVSIDGQTAQVVTDNDVVGVGKATLTFQPGRAITISKGSASSFIISVGLRMSSDPCVEIINGGVSGEQLANLATFPGSGTVAYVPLACLTAMLDANAINIVLVNGWANDYLNGATALQSATYLNTLLNQIRLLNADTVYVNYAALDPTNSISQSVQDAYSAQCIATAIGGAAPSGVIDFSKVIPSYPIGNAAGLYWDPKHLGSMGQAYAAQLILRAILGVIPSQP